MGSIEMNDGKKRKKYGDGNKIDDKETKRKETIG